jgi:multiple antibiotic resistance protein
MKHFLVDFVTLLSVMNPVAVIPIYLNLTAELQTPERKRVLVRAILVSFAILIAFLIVGEPVLDSLGVTLNAFRIAGGIVLLILGLRMIFDEEGHAHPPGTGLASSRDIAVFPLAMPMIAGSGAILSIILLTENNLHAVEEQASTALTMCLVLGVNFVVLRAANPIYQFIGPTGTAVVGRISGLIIAALAVQVMIIGLQNVFPGLALPANRTNASTPVPASR